VKGNIVQAVVVLLPCVSFRVQNCIVAFFESFFLEKKQHMFPMNLCCTELIIHTGMNGSFSSSMTTQHTMLHF